MISTTQSIARYPLLNLSQKGPVSLHGARSFELFYFCSIMVDCGVGCQGNKIQHRVVLRVLVVQNSSYKHSSHLSLITGIAPNITRGPLDSTVIDGMAVVLSCETSGAPRPAITWQKGNGELGNYSYFGKAGVRHTRN